ncbi:hypothetical protein WDU94_003266 [Cyamophila willieti]
MAIFWPWRSALTDLDDQVTVAYGSQTKHKHRIENFIVLRLTVLEITYKHNTHTHNTHTHTHIRTDHWLKITFLES